MPYKKKVLNSNFPSSPKAGGHFAFHPIEVGLLGKAPLQIFHVIVTWQEAYTVYFFVLSI
jgi:hypothetical protein